jgi:hypothetical protein
MRSFERIFNGSGCDAAINAVPLLPKQYLCRKGHGIVALDPSPDHPSRWGSLLALRRWRRRIAFLSAHLPSEAATRFFRLSSVVKKAQSR